MHHSIFISKMIVIDFNDSFTYNIVSEIYQHYKNVTVIHYQAVSFEFLKDLETKNDLLGVVLGPGPGHPLEYNKVFPAIDYMLQRPKKFKLLGICLGHQIIGSILGYSIVDSCNKVHGESVKIKYNDDSFIVQRYNSLVPRAKGLEIEKLVEDDEVVIFADKSFVSFQFHPESIGTENSNIFFNMFYDLLGK